MVKHIVIWKLKEEANGKTKAENALLLKQGLESLKNKISQVISIEVGFDFAKNDTCGDIVLYSEFASKQDLHDYQNHPDHKALGPLVQSCTCERRMLDYEI
ncbi:stress responsive protein [Bacteroidales bacterium]|nr:stress responsive protein [Bacteroidales bacterium]